jgi:hypothetical protein
MLAALVVDLNFIGFDTLADKESSIVDEKSLPLESKFHNKSS